MTLKETEEQIKKIAEAIKQTSGQAKSLDAEADGIAQKFKVASSGAHDLKEIFQKIGLPEGFSKAADLVGNLGEQSSRLKSSLKDGNDELLKSYAKEKDLLTGMRKQDQAAAKAGGVKTARQKKWYAEQLTALEQIRAKNKTLAAASTEGAQSMRDMAFGSSNLLASTAGVAKKLNAAVHSLDIMEIGAGLLAVGLVKSFQAFNAELVKASSELALHNRMYQQALAVRVATGASADQAAKAQAALAAASLQFSTNNEANLRFVTLLESSLGIAASEAAELARQSESLGANVNAVGDSMAWLANKTELSGDLTARLAIEMAKVARNLNLAGSSLPVITAAVGAMEGQFSKLGGAEGAITKLVQRFSSLQGLGDAVMFGGNRGILDPTAFDDADKLADMVANTGKQLQQLTGGDPLRLAAMEPMLQRMGLTIGDARAIMKMSGDQGEFDKLKAKMVEANKLREETGELEARYSEQLASSGKLFGNLWQRVKALTMTALLPLLKVVNWLMEGAIKATRWLTEATVYIQKSGDTTATVLRTVAEAFGALVSILVAGQLVKALGGIVKSMSAVRAATTGGGLASTVASGAYSAYDFSHNARGAAATATSTMARAAAPAAASAAVPAVAATGFARLSASLKSIPSQLKIFATGLGHAAKGLIRVLGPVGLVASIAASAYSIFDTLVLKKYQAEADQSRLRGLAADQATADKFRNTAANSALSGNSAEVSDAILLRMNRLKENGLSSDERGEIEALIKSAEAGFTRSAEVKREQAKDHPDDVAASTRIRQEHSQNMALIDTLKGELYKVQMATKAGSADQIKVMSKQEALNRTQELVQEEHRRALISSSDTYRLNKK